jgi:hypothetical protein
MKLKHFHKLDCLGRMKELSRNEGLKNSSRLRIVLQKVDKCQNYFGIATKCKEMEETHNASSLENKAQKR